MIADARRSLEEADRHDKEEKEKWEAKSREHQSRTPEEQRTWYDEYRGFRPPRKLPAEAAVYLPGWIHDYNKRMPFAEKPWFWIEAYLDGRAAWDGQCFVRSGWEEVEPHPRRYHEESELALLYPSAGDCLDAAIQIGADTGVDCKVEAYPAEVDFPTDGERSEKRVSSL